MGGWPAPSGDSAGRTIATDHPMETMMSEHAEWAAYSAALKEYRSVRANAVEMIGLIRAVAAATDRLPAFLYATFDLPPTEAIGAARQRVDLARWPDAATMRDVFAAWHGAFTRLHEAWTKVPPEDREGSRLPPDKMTID